ncbi:hypothetical protein [Paractinoplanes rishiriensis]|uniref:DUF4190 domain-containing protein n=1 Tax=Paractinoplanes rishiriensis TaxID=1050105 RepID=A0A919JVN0_9ACTN|nr:hypothetical protein [Actinoplanes rishiriensis]GIE93978.1 hypothetical protein Ari01nite_14430 [Actinoplanes rishiriensis]
MRIPTFSRQTEPATAEAERPATGTATATNTAPVRPRHDRDDTTEVRPAPTATERPLPPPPPRAVADTDKTDTGRADSGKTVVTDRTPAAAGPKPRASLLATLGLILAVVSILLVLSGPLLGYGIGVAVVALILSLSGIHATGKRHVAGKSDALIGMVVSLGAIVLGVLALTGSLYWLGTDVQPVNNLREWLDTQFVDRF